MIFFFKKSTNSSQNIFLYILPARSSTVSIDKQEIEFPGIDRKRDTNLINYNYNNNLNKNAE